MTVIFWCQLANSFGRPCTIAYFGPSATSNADFKLILIKYKHSNRYLCMNELGTVYSRHVVGERRAFLDLTLQCTVSPVLTYSTEGYICRYPSSGNEVGTN